mgnify:CR=1 FL=1
MNILFFLTPKSDVAYIYDNYSLRQVLEKMEYHKYSSDWSGRKICRHNHRR